MQETLSASLEEITPPSVLEKDASDPKERLLLVLEFIVICILIPTVIITFRLARYMFVFLWAVAFFCWAVMYFKDSAYWQSKIKFKEVNKENMKIILPRWALCTLGMAALMYFYDPGRMFYIIENRPDIIPIILLSYPLLSALPQEMIFCGYFFERFSPIIRNRKTMILASAIVFAYAHILYINWVAPLLSLIAGFIFAATYNRTHSLALVTIEHALYGISLFMIGLGWYFYGGAVHG